MTQPNEKVFSQRYSLAVWTSAPRRASLEQTFKEVLEFFPLDRRYIGTLEQRTGLSQFSTVLISRYVNAITLVAPTAGAKSVVEIKQYAKEEIRTLKELTWHYVILNNELATLQHGQTQAVRIVFKTMCLAVKNNRRLFPPAYQEELAAAEGDMLLQTRVVVDYVASMTEHEVAHVYALLTGK
jgi:dGTP triphosphohydrolase